MSDIEIQFDHITNLNVEPCPHCASTLRHYGYGLAGGGLGSYEICLGCDKMLSKDPDPDADSGAQRRRDPGP